LSAKVGYRIIYVVY